MQRIDPATPDSIEPEVAELMRDFEGDWASV